MNYFLKEKKEKLDKALNPYKILWGWIKANRTNFSEFMDLLEYLAEEEKE